MHLAWQNGFYLVSQWSLTLRLSLLVREFARLSGHTIRFHVGSPMQAGTLANVTDRRLLIEHLRQEVHRLDPNRR